MAYHPATGFRAAIGFLFAILDTQGHRLPYVGVTALSISKHYYFRGTPARAWASFPCFICQGEELSLWRS